MTEPSLHELEREVANARARLARDLDTLRSPATIAQFTDSLKQEAVATKDELVDKARTAAQERLHHWVDTLKARAAANPIAVLAIGAGLAWRMLRHPPITTALVGAGLVSLLRGNGTARGLSDAEYLAYAQARLKRQSAEMSAEIAEKAGSVASAAREKVAEWSADAASELQQRGRRLTDRAAASASDTADDLAARWDEASASAARAMDRAGRTASEFQRTVTNQEVGDKLLLGAAAVAVTAALGIAAQRRIGQMEPVD